MKPRNPRMRVQGGPCVVPLVDGRYPGGAVEKRMRPVLGYPVTISEAVTASVMLSRVSAMPR